MGVIKLVIWEKEIKAEIYHSNNKYLGFVSEHFQRKKHTIRAMQARPIFRYPAFFWKSS